MSTSNSLALLGVSSAALTLALGASAQAQEPSAPASAEGEFIGTIQLGESKRAVQTDTAAPVTVIDKEEIDDRQAGTIAELIDSVPGVSLVNGSTPSGSGINIRGFGANGTYGTDQKVAIQVDGASTGAEELYRIGTQLFTDPYLYKSVTVNRGTVGSFEYGSGIIGGVVRLETIDASDLTRGETGIKVAQTLGVSTNNSGFSNSTTLAIQPSEGLELLGNFSYREQDEQDDGNGDVIGNSAFDLPSYLAKAKYSFGPSREHSLSASYSQTSTSERDVPYDQFGLGGGFFGNVDRDIKTQTGSLIYRFQPAGNDLIDFETVLSYANQEIDSTAINGPSALLDADHQYETYRLTIKNGSFVKTGAVEQNLRYGVDLIRKERLDASSAPGGTDERFAAFLVDEINLTDAFTISGAVRYETSQLEGTGSAEGVARNSDAVMGGVSARYAIGAGFALFGSYAYTESLPILDDLTSGTTVDSITLIDLAEKATTWEAGFSYDVIGGFLGDGNAAAFKLNYYNTQLDDITSYSAGSLDYVNLEGFEAEGSLGLSTGTYMDFNANIVSGTEYAFSGDTTDWRNLTQDSVRATLGQRIGNWLDLSGELVHAFENNGDTFAEAYTVANFRATLKVPDGVLEGLQVRLGLENAFNKQYEPILATRPQPGRNLKLTVSKVF